MNERYMEDENYIEYSRYVGGNNPRVEDRGNQYFENEYTSNNYDYYPDERREPVYCRPDQYHVRQPSIQDRDFIRDRDRTIRNSQMGGRKQISQHPHRSSVHNNNSKNIIHDRAAYPPSIYNLYIYCSKSSKSLPKREGLRSNSMPPTQPTI